MGIKNFIYVYPFSIIMFKLNIKKYFSTIAVIMLLIFLHFTKILLPVENLLVEVLKPLSGKLYSAGSYVKKSYDARASKENLTELSEKLRDEVNRLLVENAKLKTLEEENRVLREYVKFSKRSESSFLVANVISRASADSSGVGRFIIDKGSSDGIEAGEAVIFGDGIILGKIVETKDKLSSVCLINNENCKLAASIQNEEGTSGIASGDKGLIIKMEFIPQTESIKEGDTVITSGLEEKIKRGLLIGKINKVNKESNELWQSAIIESLFNLDNVSIVSVLK